MRRSRAELLELKAHRPARPTRDQTWRLLQRVAENAVPGIRRDFLAAVRELGAEWPVAELEAALLARDTEGALALLPWDAFGEALTAIETRLAPVRARAFGIAGERIPPLFGLAEVDVGEQLRGELAVSFDVTSQDVRDAIEARAATRLVDVTDETRAAVRETVARGYDRGLHPRGSAREIRRIVGLTRRQAAAVARYRLSLEGAEKPAPQAKIDRLVDRYADRLHRDRAETIARTEAITAMNDGQRAQWERLQAEGLLSGDEFEREWQAIVPGGGRTCPRCLNMDGRRAPIGGVYNGDPSGPVTGPTLHPKCRCSESLVPIGVDESG